VGLLFALATATEPATFASGLLAVVVASLTARVLRLDDGLRASGYFGYNALLVGAGIGHCYARTWLALSLVAFAATTAVALTAAARAWLTRLFALPILSLPFLAVFWLVAWAAPTLDLAQAGQTVIPVPALGFAGFFADHARCLGSIVFVPTVGAGVMVAAGLLLHSRLASLFAFGAFTMLWAVNAALPSPLPPPVFSVLAANAMLLSIVVGGVWFLPSRWSALWACAGALGCLLVTVGLARPFFAAGIPLLFLPFNALSLTALLAARERSRDEKPQSVDFLPGSPEQNLEYVFNQRTRFPLCHGMRFQLPFRGRWTCTQGVDGEHTHQGLWRHGLDFQVLGDDGALYAGSSTELANYHGFRLPVLAAAAGVVVKVENDVPDNPIGRMDVVRNWGNVVVLQHGPGLYSLVAHLARRSIKVKEGQQVAQGEVLGLCGNSGRSPTPHIHFHLQAAPHLGAATLPVVFGDVVTDLGKGERLELSHLPAKGEVCRNLEPNPDWAERVCPRPGGEWRLCCGDEPELIGFTLDLLGHVRLQSNRQASLVSTQTAQMLVLGDVVGDEGSVLALLRAAIPRLPLEENGTLHWRDHVRLDSLKALPWFTRLSARLLPQAGLAMRYASHKDGDSVVVDGVSSRTDKHGVPVLRTRLVLDAQLGPRSVLVQHKHGRLCAQRPPALTAPTIVPELRLIDAPPISETKESP